MPNFWQTLTDDLEANTGRRGPLRGVLAYLYHPGFCTIVNHRLCHRLTELGRVGAGAAAVLHRLSIFLTQCYIEPSATIGPGLGLPHAVGVVIGQGVRIGSHAVIYQNVTIGAGKPNGSSYPVIEDEAVICANAVVIGDITIGQGALIGALSLVRSDVPAGCVAAGNPARILPSGPILSRGAAALQAPVPMKSSARAG
ncbi:serine O-acetyltransferase [Inquilinus sp. YAF38]|uniref:serine O-acetyltransferase n=1 Tax=Inquilinus sp. YAF38 TaxID=3233084 RepID=UPI003F92DA6E